MKNKKLLVILIVTLANLSFLFGQTEEDTPVSSENFVLTYNRGVEYSYSLDFALYNSIPFYKMWQQGMNDLSPKLIDFLGNKGHVFRIVNQFEWRKDKLSFTAFANLTANYFPAFFDTSLSWFPQCLKGAFNCFKATIDIWRWGLSGGWLLVNLCTLFAAPLVASSICALSGIVCLIAAPLSILVLAIPMVSIGGSIDYHPYSNDFFDSKLSLGLDIDGYRFMLHGGIAGFFAQAEAAAYIKNIRLYTQAGYRFDFVNLVSTVKTNRGQQKPGYESKYVPAPYIKAGVTWCFGRD